MAGVLASLRLTGVAAPGERWAPMRRSQWALIVASILGPMLLFAAVGWWSYVRVQDEASDQIERTVDILHQEGLRFFETERYQLQNVDLELLGLSWPEIIERRGRFNALLDETAAQIPEVEAMFVGDADGTTQLSSRAAQIAATGKTAANVRDRSYFKQAQAGASLVIDGPLQSRMSGETVVAIVHRLSSSDNSFRGIVVVNVDVNRLVRSWRAVTTLRERRLARARRRHDPRALPGAARAARARRRRQSALLAAPRCRLGPVRRGPPILRRDRAAHRLPQAHAVPGLHHLCRRRSEHRGPVVPDRGRVRRHRRRRLGRAPVRVLRGHPPRARRGRGLEPGRGDGACAEQER